MPYRDFNPTQLGEHLIHHIKNNNLEIVRELLALDADINHIDNYGDTATHIACEMENLDLLTILVNAGADLSIKNLYGHTPLHLVSLHSSPECLQYLLTKHLIVNVPNRINNTPLHFACTNYLLHNINLLLEVGADVNLQNISGDTPLHLIFQNEFPKISLATFNDTFQLFLQSEPNLELINLNNQTVLDLVITYNHHEFIPLLHTYNNHYELKKSIPHENSQIIINQKKIKNLINVLPL